MDPSERLRQDQERQKRQRENAAKDRGNFIKALKSRSIITDTRNGIKAKEREKERDEALESMWTAWPSTRAAIERCTTVTPEVQKKWVERLEDIKISGKWAAAEQLDELEREVNGLVGDLSRISEDLHKAAERRKASESAQIFPELTIPEHLRRAAGRRRPYVLPDLSARDVLPSGLLPGGFDALRTNRLAEDLQPTYDSLMVMLMYHVPHKLRFAWINQLEQIDKRGHGTRSSSAERTETLAAAIEAGAADLRSVASALGAQAARCRLYWR